MGSHDPLPWLMLAVLGSLLIGLAGGAGGRWIVTHQLRARDDALAREVESLRAAVASRQAREAVAAREGKRSREEALTDKQIEASLAAASRGGQRPPPRPTLTVAPDGQILADPVVMAAARAAADRQK